MNRYIKILGVVILIGAIVCIGRCTYMVLCISCSPPGIKKYEYSGNIDLFENKMKAFSRSNPGVTLKISYRDNSDRTNSTARDMLIELKNNSGDIIYHLAYIQRKPDEFTSVYLDDIHDEIHKSGGNDTDSASVKILFNGFKNNFLLRLNNNHIILKPQFFYFY